MVTGVQRKHPFNVPGVAAGAGTRGGVRATAVLEEYANWLAGEAATVHRDGSVTVNFEVAALPPDSFEQPTGTPGRRRPLRLGHPAPQLGPDLPGLLEGLQQPG